MDWAGDAVTWLDSKIPPCWGMRFPEHLQTRWELRNPTHKTRQARRFRRFHCPGMLLPSEFDMMVRGPRKCGQSCCIADRIGKLGTATDRRLTGEIRLSHSHARPSAGEPFYQIVQQLIRIRHRGCTFEHVEGIASGT